MYGESKSMDGATVLNYKWAGDEPIKYTNWDKAEPGASMRCVFPFKYGRPGVGGPNQNEYNS